MRKCDRCTKFFEQEQEDDNKRPTANTIAFLFDDDKRGPFKLVDGPFYLCEECISDIYTFMRTKLN